MVNFFTNIASFSVRPAFARLHQICAVLTLDELNDIHHYWGSNAGRLKWRLQAQDARRVLELRVDFDPAHVQALAL